MTAVLPTEITDPINARILAVSRTASPGFSTTPSPRSRGSPELPARDGARAAAGDARGGHDPPHPPDAHGHEPRAGRAGRVAASRRSEARRGVRLPVEGGSRSPATSSSARTDAETPGSVYRLWTTLKVPQGFSMQKHCELLARAHRRRRVPHHAREAAVRARRRPRAPARHGAGQQDRRAGPGDRHEHRRALRARVARARPRSSASSRRTRCDAEPWRARADEAGVSYDEFLRVARALAERGVIGRFSTFLEHVKPSATGDARHALQRALPLARAPGPRDRGGTRGRPSSHPHARLLARGRPGVRAT